MMNVDVIALQTFRGAIPVAPKPNEVANAVLSKSTWAVLGLTLMIELFTQTHYLRSIQPDQECSALYKDVFLYHWKEESQHARIDELEWVRENAAISAGERDAAVNDMTVLSLGKLTIDYQGGAVRLELVKR